MHQKQPVVRGLLRCIRLQCPSIFQFVFVVAVVQIVVVPDDGMACQSSAFDDVPSKTVVSEVILEGRKFDAPAYDNQTYSAGFRVEKILKGRLAKTDKPSGSSGPEVIRVADRENSSECIRMLIDGGKTKFLIFVDSTPTVVGQQLPVYYLSDRPEMFTKRAVNDVKKHSCRTCGKSEIGLYLLYTL